MTDHQVVLFNVYCVCVMVGTVLTYVRRSCEYILYIYVHKYHHTAVIMVLSVYIEAGYCV